MFLFTIETFFRMVEMLKIYISSTYEDLKEERKAAAQAVRSMGHIAIGMEDYVASDSRPVDKCLDDVRSCDVYMGIFAWRYGFIPNGYDKSITHLEYEAAGNAGIPRLIFLLKSSAPWPRDKMEKGKGAEKIEKLRNELRENHTVNFFANADQLGGKIAIGLKDIESSIPQIQRKIEEDFKKPDMSSGRQFGKDVIMEKFDRTHEEEVPEEVKSVKSKAHKIYKNDKGFREADYGDGIIMVYIPEGEFKMGQTEEEKQWLINHIGNKDYNEYHKNQLSLHDVYLDGYWIGKYEVTFDQYDKYCEATGENSPDDEGWGRRDRPVINLSWEDANAYCNWLSKKKGLNFKLPTEAQWEKAARGADGRKYPWGNNEPDETMANFEEKGGKTSPVGSYPNGASPYGLLDMAGNVWEWCRDWYGSDYYRKSSERNPPGPRTGTTRVLRGGSWSNDAANVRCAFRGFEFPLLRINSLGFRLCQDNRGLVE
jgi:formylglycine-generating enzyme required for sulfatase activity